MTDPTTLGEVLDKWEGKGRATCGQTGGAIHDFTQDLRRILYGTDEPCPEPDFYHWVTTQPCCGTCHNTRRLKTPGVVERLKHQVFDAAVAGDGPEMPNTSAALVYGAGLTFEALEREIGEITP